MASGLQGSHLLRGVVRHWASAYLFGLASPSLSHPREQMPRATVLHKDVGVLILPCSKGVSSQLPFRLPPGPLATH